MHLGTKGIHCRLLDYDAFIQFCISLHTNTKERAASSVRLSVKQTEAVSMEEIFWLLIFTVFITNSVVEYIFLSVRIKLCRVSCLRHLMYANRHIFLKNDDLSNLGYLEYVEYMSKANQSGPQQTNIKPKMKMYTGASSFV